MYSVTYQNFITVLLNGYIQYDVVIIEQNACNLLQCEVLPPPDYSMHTHTVHTTTLFVCFKIRSRISKKDNNDIYLYIGWSDTLDNDIQFFVVIFVHFRPLYSSRNYRIKPAHPEPRTYIYLFFKKLIFKMQHFNYTLLYGLPTLWPIHCSN